MTLKNSKRTHWTEQELIPLDDTPKRKVHGITELRYRRAWSFPPLVEFQLEKLLEPPSVNICCGTSSLCDLKVDLFMQGDIRGDMFRLPFKDEAFQTVFSDPPWNMPYHVRPKYCWEMRRIVKKGGKFILNCPWVPKIPKMILESVMIGVPKAAWKNCIPVATYRKPLDDIRSFIGEISK